MTTVDPTIGARLGEVLAASDYSEEGISRVLGPRPELGFWADREVYRRRLGDDRVATLVRLFYLGEDVREETASKALAPLELRELVDAMMIEAGPGTVRSRALISGYGDMLFASDVPKPAPEPDFVTGANSAAVKLARLTIRRDVATMLDLGTGCGIQGLLAARHTGRVAGVDINPRALAFAELNAQMNDVSNYEGKLGSWFEPIGGRAFDLIAANPPFAVSPDAEFLFRDTDDPRDEISLWTIREIPSYLNEGAFGHVICHWVHDGNWRRPLEASLEGRGCDAVLLHYHTADPASYAGAWNHPLLEGDLSGFGHALDRWIDHYRHMGIEAIAWGVVVLRRRESGHNWVRAVEVPSRAFGNAGEHVARMFAAKDYLDVLGQDAQLLDEVFAPPEGTRFERRSEWIGGREAAGPALVKLPSGIGFAARIDPRAIDVVARCDGKRRLGEIADEASAEFKAEPGEVRAAAVTGVKRLLELGFLDPPVH